MTAPKKVFITGANGFLGQALVQRYKQSGVEVGGLDISADPENNIIAGDLTRDGAWQQAMQGSDVVIHSAALVSNTAPYQKCWEVNVAGTRKVLETTATVGVSRFVQISSVAAFGFDYADGVDETAPLQPEGHPYVDTKIASEHVVLAAHGAGEIDASIVRPGDVYGPECRPWVIQSMEMIKAGKMLLPANGKGVFTPVYIDDIVDGIVLAASKVEASGQIFTMDGGEQVACEDYFGYLYRFLGKNEKPRSVGTGTAIFIAEAVGRFERLLGKPSELGKNTVGMLARKGGYSIDKARRLLGYDPRVTLEEGMQRVKQWLVAEGQL